MEPYQTKTGESIGDQTPPPAFYVGGGESPPALLGKQHEITAPPLDGKAALHRRLERFELHATVRDILTKEARVCKCLHTPRQKYVEVWKSAKNQLHYYGGLVICGSVWACPLCAAKISEHRANEIQAAVKSWEAQGGTVQMLTLTFPHYENQKCTPLLDLFGKSRRLMKHRPSYKTLTKHAGLVGEINRTEVTYGDNGWHIHSHTLLFTKGKVRLTAPAMFPLWAEACKSTGLPSPSKAHGVKISTPKELSDYLAKQGKEASKWTIEKEMTKGHIKVGKFEGMTPFDFLRAYRDTKEEKWANLFREYFTAFKGKRQLVWSKGLRKLLDLVPEITDEEAAQSQDELDDLIRMIDQKLWDYIRKHNFRGKLLEAANLGKDTFAAAIDVLQASMGRLDTPF